MADINHTLTNPGAETGDTTGWTNEIGSLDVRSASPSPYAGSYYFFGGANAETKASQEVDLVTDGVSTTAIDAGDLFFKVAWYQSSYLTKDEGAMIVRFKNASKTEISSTTAPLFAVRDQLWRTRSMVVEMPANTRYVDVIIHGVRYDGTNNDAYFDDISCATVESMPGTTYSFDSGGTGSLPGGGDPDYSSFLTWESDTDNDLTGAGIITLECYDSQVHVGSLQTAAGCSGVDPNNRRRVISSPSCSTPFAGKVGTGAKFKCVGGVGYIVTIGESFFELRDLSFEFQCSVDYYGYKSVELQGLPGQKIINCIVHDGVNTVDPVNNWVYGIYVNFGYSASALIHNTIVYGCSGPGIHVRNLYSGEDAETKIISCCTVIGNGTIAGHGFSSESTAGELIVWSCYGADNGDGATYYDFEQANWDAPSGWNASKDDSADLGGIAGDNYKNNIDLTDTELDSDYLALVGQTLSWNGTAGNRAGRNPYDDLAGSYDFYDFFQNDTSGDSLSKKDIAGNDRPTPDTADVSWPVGASYNPTPPNELEANLPTLELEAYSGSSLSSNLPTLEVTGRFGSTLEATLPTLELEGAFLQPGLFGTLPTLEIDATGYQLTTLNAQLPTLEITATGYQIPALYTDPRPGRNPKLPELRVEMSGTCPGKIEGLLPCLEMTARVGARGEMKLPALSMEARISTGGHGYIDASLPPLEIVEARAGSRFKNLKLPPLMIEATGSAGSGAGGSWAINAKLPALQITATSLTNPMVIDATLPALGIVMAGSRKIVGQIEAMLPGLRISAHAELMVVGELSAILPDLRLAASGHCQTMIIEATLPALLMTKFASGDDYGGSDSVMTNPNRFSTDLLRYERWPV